MADQLFDRGGGYNVTPRPSGVTASASFLPVAASYGAGDIVATPQEFIFAYDNGLTVPDGSLIRILTTIVKVDATALVASEGAYSLPLYAVTPPSAKADNALWALESLDLTAYRGTISLGTPVDLGNACYIKTPGIDIDVKLVGHSLFGNLVTAAAFTIPAVIRQVLLYGVVL